MPYTITEIFIDIWQYLTLTLLYPTKSNKSHGACSDRFREPNTLRDLVPHTRGLPV